MNDPQSPPNTIEQANTSHSNKSQNNSPANRSSQGWLWLLLSCLAVGGGIAWFTIPREAPASPPAAKTNAPPPRPVSLVELKSGNGARQVQLLGQVEASERATLRSRTEGAVQNIFVNPGDRIRAGQTIMTLDNTDQQLALTEAQARLAQEKSQLARLEVGTRPEIIDQRRAAVRSAKAREQEARDNLRRTSELVTEGAVSQRLLVESSANVDEAHGDLLSAEAALAEAQAGPTREEIAAQKATVSAAQAVVSQAKLAVSRTRIVADSVGVIQTRQVSPGDFLKSGDAIATLVSSNNLDIFLELPEDLSGKIKPGQPIALSTRALDEWQGRATITAVVPSADAVSRRQRVRVRLATPPSGLLPGMAVEGTLTLRAQTAGFVVSRDALTRRQNQWWVFTIADKKAKPHVVQLVADMGLDVAITGDTLRAGDRIVLKGGDGLRAGMPVKVVQ
jgi:HlyD family secretion protein